jgi:O-antigen ligase
MLRTNSLESNNKSSVFTNYIGLIYVMSLFTIDFLGYFDCYEIINPQFLYLSVLNVIMGIYFYTHSHLVSPYIIPIVKKSIVFKTYILFLFFCFFSLFFAVNYSEAIINFMRILVIFSIILNLILLFYKRLHLIYYVTLIIGFALLFQTTKGLYLLYKTETILDGLNSLKGNTGNINIFSVSIGIKIPFIILGIIHFKNYKKFFLVLVLILASTTLLLTGTRSTMLSLLLEIIIFTFFYFKIHSFKKSSFIPILLVIIPIMVSVFIANQILKTREIKDQRYESVTNRLKQIQVTQVTDASETMRLFFWKNAIKITQQHPIFGVGLGNYKVESIPYEKEFLDDDLLSVHPHNDFLEIFSETGIVNGIVYFSIFILVFFVNLKSIFSNSEKEKKTISLITLLILIVYGIDAMLNFPLYRPTMQLGFAFLMALTLINNNNQNKNEISFDKNTALVMVILATVTLFFAFTTFKASVLENEIKGDIVKQKSKLTANYIQSNLPRFSTIGATGDPFLEYLGIYLYKEKRFKEATKVFDLAAKTNPYMGRADHYKSYMTFIRKQNGAAAHYAKKALIYRSRNFEYYNKSLYFSALNKDITSVLSSATIFNTYRNTAHNWVSASYALLASGYTSENTIRYLDQGIKQFPKDTVLINFRKKIQKLDESSIKNTNFAKKIYCP